MSVATDDNTNRWYAVYTRSRCEKKVDGNLRAGGIETYLPLHRVRRRWSDRIAEVDLPLFPSYLFVNVEPRPESFWTVLDARGVVRILSNNGTYAPVPEREITAVKQILAAAKPVKSLPWLQRGREVRVATGPLRGMEGVFDGHGRKERVFILVKSIGQSLVVDIDARDVREA